mmetsp:Transcript_10000/g.28029  ORF Transcript_10000/g.28029 Transcript_10000/m.28029 type:complete len:313 (+) Transcript_10000:133-1071(+)
MLLAVSAESTASTETGCTTRCCRRIFFVCTTARAYVFAVENAAFGSQSVAISAVSAINGTSAATKSSPTSTTTFCTRFWNSSNISQAACGSSSLRRRTSMATCGTTSGTRFCTCRTRLATGRDHGPLFSRRAAAWAMPETSGSNVSAASALSTSPPTSSRASCNSLNASSDASHCNCKDRSLAALSGSQSHKLKARRGPLVAASSSTWLERCRSDSWIAGQAAVTSHFAWVSACLNSASQGLVKFTSSSSNTRLGRSSIRCLTVSTKFQLQEDSADTDRWSDTLRLSFSSVLTSSLAAPFLYTTGYHRRCQF